MSKQQEIQMKKASNGFETGDIVTVINERDIMYKFQGEVKSTYVDDEDTNEIMVVVRFHVKVVGDRPDLRRVGDYYEGIKSSAGPMTFEYMNRNPDISSIRVDEGYTKANKLKLGLVRS
jgi:hypothetical protein